MSWYLMAALLILKTVTVTEFGHQLYPCAFCNSNVFAYASILCRADFRYYTLMSSACMMPSYYNCENCDLLTALELHADHFH